MATYKQRLDEAYSTTYRVGFPNESDCSGFVITAAKALGVHLPDKQADGLLVYMEANWLKHGVGQDGLTAAKKAAAKSSFVVVGASAADLHDTNGHVAVLLGKVRGGWPRVYGGAKNARARTQGEMTLNYVFRREHHPKLQYYSPRDTVVEMFDSGWE